VDSLQDIGVILGILRELGDIAENMGNVVMPLDIKKFGKWIGESKR